MRDVRNFFQEKALITRLDCVKRVCFKLLSPPHQCVYPCSAAKPIRHFISDCGHFFLIAVATMILETEVKNAKDTKKEGRVARSFQFTKKIPPRFRNMVYVCFYCCPRKWYSRTLCESTISLFLTLNSRIVHDRMREKKKVFAQPSSKPFLFHLLLCVWVCDPAEVDLTISFFIVFTFRERSSLHNEFPSFRVNLE
jgi:hypothetical protein